jgi:hypothetical protein
LLEIGEPVDVGVYIERGGAAVISWRSDAPKATATRCIPGILPAANATSSSSRLGIGRKQDPHGINLMIPNDSTASPINHNATKWAKYLRSRRR